MPQRIEFTDDPGGYLRATLSDTVITNDRAHEILRAIGNECRLRNRNRVLLDERSVERRDVAPPDILSLGRETRKTLFHRIHIAFLCGKALVNRDAEMLREFTFTDHYVIQYFTDADEAVRWLTAE